MAFSAVSCTEDHGSSKRVMSLDYRNSTTGANVAWLQAGLYPFEDALKSVAPVTESA